MKRKTVKPSKEIREELTKTIAGALSGDGRNCIVMVDRHAGEESGNWNVINFNNCSPAFLIQAFLALQGQLADYIATLPSNLRDELLEGIAMKSREGVDDID